MSSAKPKQPLRTWARKPAEAYLAALHDDNPRVRRQAVAALEITGCRPAVPAILPLLADSDDSVRLIVVRTLASLGNKRTITALIGALSNSSERMRGALIAALERHGALEQCRTPEAVTALIAALSASQMVRYSAARALGVIRDPRAITPLVAALRLELSIPYPHGHFGDSIAISLGRHGPDALPELLQLVGDPDTRLRRLAAVGLRHAEDIRAMEPLRELLHDEDESVRVMAGDVLWGYEEGFLGTRVSDNGQ